ncbi:hypothetical protein MMC25_001471 [Agyrium rufum]|nr:hypothetical protein [Agyrium rufum]
MTIEASHSHIATAITEQSKEAALLTEDQRDGERSTKRPKPDHKADVPKSPPEQPMTRSSEATRLTAALLRKLVAAVAKDPKVDLTTLIPKTYVARLAERKRNPVVYPLLDNAQGVLALHRFENTQPNDDTSLATAMASVLSEAEVIYTVRPGVKFIVKLNDHIVIKVRDLNANYMGYTTLQYPEQHRPDLPIPRSHSLLKSDKSTYIFQTCIPGPTFNQVWPTFDVAHKKALRNGLDGILSDLRQLERPEDTALRGTAGEGCKPARRFVSTSIEPLYPDNDLWNWQYFKNPWARGSDIFLVVLRRITEPFEATKCVFMHGDIRMANIIVQLQDVEIYVINGIIDWESSFYPEDFERIKALNNRSTHEDSDWSKVPVLREADSLLVVILKLVDNVLIPELFRDLKDTVVASPMGSLMVNLTVNALTSFYTFLTTFPYLPGSAIRQPPRDIHRWQEDIVTKFRHLGKSNAVIDLLAHLPYIEDRAWNIGYDSEPLDYVGEMKMREENDLPMAVKDGLEPYTEKLPNHVCCITFGGQYGSWLLLDTEDGTFTNYSQLGETRPESANQEEIQKGTSWRHCPRIPVTEFFNSWKEKFRSLEWVPVPDKDGEVRGKVWVPDVNEDQDLEELRAIYREYGWGSEDFRKEQCREALQKWGAEFDRKLLEGEN